MSWAGIANNQCVSCENLQNAVSTGVFTLKNTIPSSTPAKYKQVTKDEAEYYVNLNTAYAPLAAKTFNQLVVKSNLQGCTTLPYSYVIYFESQEDGYYGWTASGDACTAAEPNALTVYSSSSSITAGAALYVDSCGTEQLSATSYDTSYPYFRYASSYITFENWDATNRGYVVRSVTACFASTVTLDWAVGAQSGGNLTILNVSGTELIDVNSTAGSVQSGTLTIPYAQLPYTIRGSWVGGSGNIIKFRVCDIGGELYLSGNITAGGSEDYTPSPTPTYASVYLTANNVTPPYCVE